MRLVPRKKYHLLQIGLLAFAFAFSFLKPSLADEDAKYSTGGISALEFGSTFIVSGDKFTFSETESGMTSFWEGNVVASSRQINIHTDRLEINLTSEDKIKFIKASPNVLIELLDDSASATIRGKMFEYDFETQTGHVDMSVIEIHAKPEAFNLPEESNYVLFVLSERTDIIAGDLIVQHPEIRLNSLEDPEVTIRGKELTIKSIGESRRMRIRKISVNLFGHRIIYFPWPYDKQLTKKAAGGFSSDTPNFGFDKDGLETDIKFYYTFMNPPLENTAMVFRFDLFTNDRWFPELIYRDMSEKELWDLKYGYERLDDHMGDHILVFKKPDFNLRFPSQDVLNRFTFSSGVGWGQLEEPIRQVESSRLAIHAGLARKPIELGNSKCTLNLEGKWRKQFYSDGDDYEVIEESIGIRQNEKGKYNLGLTYYHREDRGFSPFVYDREEILDELKWRSRTRLTDSWSGGFDARYDLDKSNFRDLELVATKIYNSFQLALKWDFADASLGVEFGFPGSL